MICGREPQNLFKLGLWGVSYFVDTCRIASCLSTQRSLRETYIKPSKRKGIFRTMKISLGLSYVLYPQYQQTYPPLSQKQKTADWAVFCFLTLGADRENRTPAISLATICSTTKLYPRWVLYSHNTRHSSIPLASGISTLEP